MKKYETEVNSYRKGVKLADNVRTILCNKFNFFLFLRNRRAEAPPPPAETIMIMRAKRKKYIEYKVVIIGTTTNVHNHWDIKE